MARYQERALTAAVLPGRPLAVLFTPAQRESWWEYLGLLLGIGAGLAVRLRHILAYDFPLNDGGLFYVMVRDIQENGFLLPAYTSYNFTRIPFAYPPLAFYLAAFLDRIGPWSLMDIFRFLPLGANVLTIGAFYLLARAVLGKGWPSIWATWMYALLPRAFLWQLPGGGLTRSLGLLWAVLALWQGYVMVRRGEGPRLGAIIFATLAVLTHPEMGWAVVFSYMYFLLVYGRSRRGLWSVLVSGAAVAVLSSPWWATVVARHGVGVLVSASQTGKEDWLSFRFLNLIHSHLSEEPFFPLLASLGYWGMAVSIVRGQLFLPGWLLLTLYIDPRVAGTNAMVPLALQGGVGLAALAELARQHGGHLGLVPRLGRWLGSLPGELRWVASPWVPFALSLVIAYGVYSAIHAGDFFPSPLQAIPPSVRKTMEWVRSYTPGAARFLVIHGQMDPWTDAASEWFPALTGRESLATVQGYEWLGKGKFDTQLSAFWSLQSCIYEGASCLQWWEEAFGRPFDHVFILCPNSWECSSELLKSLTLDSRYRLLYGGEGGYIFRRQSPYQGVGEAQIPPPTS